jgi:hypothetical protein
MDTEKYLHAVVVGESGYVLCVTDDLDVAKRVAWTYDTYDDLITKAEERGKKEKFDELRASRKQILSGWKFGIPTDKEISGKTKVVTIPQFRIPVQLVKGYMDAYTMTKFKQLYGKKIQDDQQ